MKKKLVLPILIAGLVVSTPLASLAADNADLSVTGEAVATTEELSTDKTTEAAVAVTEPTVITEEAVATTFNEDVLGTWQKSGSRYWFQFNDGGYACNEIGTIDGVTYAFDASGWMVTSWVQFDGVWYYCNASGAMQFGWQKIDGSWYYFDPEYGNMYENGITEINGQIYRFNANGTLFYGWYQEDGSWYYFDSNGYLSTGWKYISGTWYFFDTGSHEMLSDGWYTINSVDYYFLPSGAMADGWVQQAGEWYYCPGGKDYTGWLASGSNWYYIADNWMVNDRWYTINGVDYYFLPSGAMADGWVQQAGEWYYCPGGKNYTGWLASGSNWYYIADSWMINDGVWYIGDDGELGGDNSKAYAFTASGIMVRNNWFYETWNDGGTTHGQWGYFDADGAGHEGWLLSGGKWYYCEEGAMYYDGIYKINDKYCRFDASGVWQGYVELPPQ